MKKISLLGINAEVALDFHKANNDEMGNVKTTSDGKRSYISSQRIREAIRSAMAKLNEMNEESKLYFMSNSDGKIVDIGKDITSDLFGYMSTEKEDDKKKKDKSEIKAAKKNEVKIYLKKRVSPVKVGFALAKNQQSTLEDLFVRFRNNPDESDITKNDEQRINTKIYSDGGDVFNINASVDIRELSTVKHFDYVDAKHINNIYVKMVDEDERKRRLSMFLNSTKEFEFSNFSRSKNNTYPQRVFLVFDTNGDGRYIKFFDMNERARKAYLNDLDARGAKYFIGDDITNDESILTVSEAYNHANDYLTSCELLDLSDEQLTHEEFGEKYGHAYKERKKKDDDKK